MEPSDHFDEQERSRAHLDSLGPQLAREAGEVLRDAPDAEIAGVILEAGTREYAWYRSQIAGATGKEVAPPVLAGIVPRQHLLEIAGGQGAAWIEENVPPGSGELAVLVATRNGVRLGAFVIPDPDDA